MWVKYNPNPCGRSNVGDCVVRALSAALNIDWESAFWMLCDSAFQMCDMPSGNSVMTAIMRKNGFYRGSISPQCPDCYNIKDFCAEHPIGIYVLGTGSHVVCVIDGDYYDSWDSGDEIPQYYFFKKGA